MESDRLHPNPTPPPSHLLCQVGTSVYSGGTVRVKWAESSTWQGLLQQQKWFCCFCFNSHIYFWPCWVFTVLLAFLSFRRAGAIHSVHKIYKSGWCLVGDWHSESPFWSVQITQCLFSFGCVEPFLPHVGFLWL